MNGSSSSVDDIDRALEANRRLQHLCMAQRALVERALASKLQAFKPHSVSDALDINHHASVMVNTQVYIRSGSHCQWLQHATRHPSAPTGWDALRRQALGHAVSISLQCRRPIWHPRDRELLREGVVAMLLNSTIAEVLSLLHAHQWPALPDRCNGSDATSEVNDELRKRERCELQGQLRWLQAARQRMARERVPDQLVAELLSTSQSVDWMIIRAVYLPHRSAAECEAQWTQRADPRLRRSTTGPAGAERCRQGVLASFAGAGVPSEGLHGGFVSAEGICPSSGLEMMRAVARRPTAAELRAYQSQISIGDGEVTAFRKAVEQHGEHNWERIAEYLADFGLSRRTPMGCQRYYRAVIEPLLHSTANNTIEKRRFWTSEEDEALRTAVQATGSGNDWAGVARLVPGRDRRACLLRWRHVVDPALLKGRWTTAEDSRLCELVCRYGATSWSAWVPTTMGGRSASACRERWCNQLDPALSRGQWTSEEDAALRAAVALHGVSHWGAISQYHGLEGRLTRECRQRWKTLTAVAPAGEGDRKTVLAESVVFMCATNHAITDSFGDEQSSRHSLLFHHMHTYMSGNKGVASGTHEEIVLRTTRDVDAVQRWPCDEELCVGSGVVQSDRIDGTSLPPTLEPSGEAGSGRSEDGYGVCCGVIRQPLRKLSTRWLIHRALCAGHQTRAALLYFCRTRRSIAFHGAEKHVMRVVHSEASLPLPLWERMSEKVSQGDVDKYVLTTSGKALRPDTGVVIAEDHELRTRQGIHKWPSKRRSEPIQSRKKRKHQVSPSLLNAASRTEALRLSATRRADAAKHEPKKVRQVTATHPSHLGMLGDSAHFPSDECLERLADNIEVDGHQGRLTRKQPRLM